MVANVLLCTLCKYMHNVSKISKVYIYIYIYLIQPHFESIIYLVIKHVTRSRVKCLGTRRCIFLVLPIEFKYTISLSRSSRKTTSN